MLAGGSNVSLVDSSRRYRPDTNWPGLLDRDRSSVRQWSSEARQVQDGDGTGCRTGRPAGTGGRHQRHRAVRSSVSAVPAVVRQAGPRQRRPDCGRACRGVPGSGVQGHRRCSTAGVTELPDRVGPDGHRPVVRSSAGAVPAVRNDSSVQRMNGGRKRHQDRPAREHSPGRTPQTPTQGRWFPVTHTRSPHTPSPGQCGSNRTGPGR